MTILIQNGQVINPATGMNEVADVLVENGVVSKIEKGSKRKQTGRSMQRDVLSCRDLLTCMCICVIRDLRKRNDRNRLPRSSTRWIYNDSCNAEHQTGC